MGGATSHLTEVYNEEQQEKAVKHRKRKQPGTQAYNEQT